MAPVRGCAVGLFALGKADLQVPDRATCLMHAIDNNRRPPYSFVVLGNIFLHGDIDSLLEIMGDAILVDCKFTCKIRWCGHSWKGIET